MTAEEELIDRRHEKRLLREQASLQQELSKREQEQIRLLERELSRQQEQLTQLAEQVKALQERLGKESHPGKTLLFAPCPDEVLVHRVERGAQCQADLRQVPPRVVERRQVVDVPPTRLLVREHHSEQKQCPQHQRLPLARARRGCWRTCWPSR